MVFLVLWARGREPSCCLFQISGRAGGGRGRRSHMEGGPGPECLSPVLTAGHPAEKLSVPLLILHVGSPTDLPTSPNPFSLYFPDLHPPHLLSKLCGLSTGHFDMGYCFWQPSFLPPSLVLSVSLSLLSHNVVMEQRKAAGTCSLSGRRDGEAWEGVEEEEERSS